MKKNKSRFHLDADEQVLMDSIENEPWQENALSVKRRKTLIRAAKATRKDDKINIRIAKADKLAIMECAEKEGIPYQTLICSILHKYQTGQLLDVRMLKNSKVRSL